MSKSKRNQVLFNKPEDPKFLKLLKQEAGYKEGPNIDTKRQKFDQDYDSEDRSDSEEERPQVCVLRKGDLTEAEAEAEKLKIDKESNEKPADLSERIIFKAKSKKPATEKGIAETSTKSKVKKGTSSNSKLSFEFKDDEEEEE